MSGSFSGIFLPCCALLFSTLLCIIYFSKKRINLIENKAYSLIVLSVFLDSILALAIQIIAINGISMPETLFINIINKLDFITLIIYSNCLFFYTLVITFKLTLKKIKKVIIIGSVVDLILIIGLMFNKIIIISDGIYYSVSGISAMITFATSGLYIASSLLITLFNIRKADKRHIPILMISLFIILILVAFLINPYLVIISITLTFINYIMYFTIENPDVRMINELELAKSQAEKANHAKSDFLSSMSHEIRTPLNAIVGLSEVIKENDNIEEIHEDANDVIMASKTLLEIVNGILDISKIEANKMEIVEVNYNPSEVFEELKTLIETRLVEKDIEFKNNIAIDIPNNLYGDKGKLKQIVTNLLTNAIKYTEKGYINFNVKCINNDETTDLIITVSDTGRGIKESQMDKLFTKFNRLEEDKNTTIEGTGLGLAITKSLIDMMGGKIVVNSTYGEGSRFTVYLTQKRTSKETEEKKEIVLDYAGNKVLVVDDNKLNLKVIKKLFESYKLTVDIVESGFDCIDKVNAKNEYALIFMDIMMPKMSGVETLKKLKSIDTFNIPVVALTADAMEGKKNKYIEVGFTDYLSKPIDKQELIELLNRMLYKKKEMNKINYITDEDIELLNKKVQLENDIISTNNRHS